MKPLIAVLILVLIPLLLIGADAEEHDCYILCNPESFVHIRRTPKKAENISGSLECGEAFKTDGKTKNGYVHLIGLTEDGEGWVYAGYVVEDQPTISKTFATVAATGRVMARQYINGKYRDWIAVGTDIKVYAFSEEWAVTSKGFVRTKYLEMWE